MNPCHELTEQLHRDASAQVELAMIAETSGVAAMHLDLAIFDEKQATIADEECTEELAAMLP